MAPLTVPSVALAQPPADPTLQAAHARFAEGVAFYDKGQFENARASFLQAYALHKHPAVLINLAQSSLRSGHILDADRFFTRYIHDSASLSAAQRAEAEKGLTEARKQLGRIDVSAPSGTAVTIDGELAGTDGPASLDVEAGNHVVKGGDETTSVVVGVGQSVSVRLGKSTGAPAAAPVEPAPPASSESPVTPAAEAPSLPPPPPAGASGPGVFSRPATLAPVWVGAGVSVAGFATAILFAAFKSSAQSSYNGEVNAIKTAVGADSKGKCVNPTMALAAACGEVSSDGKDVNNDATAANIGIAVGVVGAGFALGWYLFAPKEEKAETKTSWPHLQPVIGSRGGGLALGGSF